jgi:cobalt/nickel transport system ATP-binding protein
MGMTEPLIRITGLAAGYDRQVLNHVDLELHAGERLALLGDNGAGKSTLLHALVGLIPVTGGSIEAFGQSRRREDDFRDMRRRAGLVFQDPDDQLFCPTVLEDVAFGPLNMGQSMAEARATALATLEQLGLAAFSSRITHRLSGGEKRLISIAAVLAMQPDVLLLDEPTAGLDEGAYERLCALLLGLPQAMIIVAHEARFISRLASRAILIKDGRSYAGTVHEHELSLRQAHLHVPGLLGS